MSVPKLQILTLDPGITTGIVVAHLSKDAIELRPQQYRYSESQLYDYMQRLKPDVIIYEDFEYRTYKNSKTHNVPGIELFPRNLIGVVNLYIQQGGTMYYVQKPSTGEGGYYKDADALKREGVYVPGKDYHHSMSAMRHFMYWLKFGAGFQYWNNQNLTVVK